MQKKSSKLFIFFIFLLLFSVSLALIGTGVYYYKISQKEYIFHKLIDSIFEKGSEIVTIDQDYLLGDSFQMEGNINIDIQSDYYEKKSLEKEEYAKKNQLFKNLSLMDIDYVIAQDHTKKEFYTYSNGKINDKDIFINKRLIYNSTEYLFYNDVYDQYINNGNNTYFEALNAETTTVDNIKYLYNFIKESLKKHITNDDLMLYEVSTYVGDEEVLANQISYTITDDSLKKLLKAVLKDIKNDDKAKDIVSLVYPSLDKLKINDKKKIIPKGENYIVNIYVSRKFYNVLKYEIVKMKDNHQEQYNYEGNRDEGNFYYTVDNELKYRANYKSSTKKVDIEVFNRFDKTIGTIHGEKDKNTIIFNMTLDLEDKKYDITYHDNNDGLSNEGFNKKCTLSYKVMDQLINILDGEIKLDAKITKNVNINEDISGAILRVGFNEEEERKINSYYENIINKLET